MNQLIRIRFFLFFILVLKIKQIALVLIKENPSNIGRNSLHFIDDLSLRQIKLGSFLMASQKRTFRDSILSRGAKIPPRLT